MTAHPRTRERVGVTLSLALFMCVVLALVSASGAQSMSADARLSVLDAVVRVIAFDWSEDAVVGAGSGTIISEQGHILTNYHVVLSQNGEVLDLLPILTAESSAPDVAPTLSYFAAFLDGDPETDVALLQAFAWADGSPIPQDHRFAHVRLGSIEAMLIGDPIFVIGYPGVSGDTITFTTGVVSGFLGEDGSSSGRRWIKTDARIARGSSGGGAFDIDGTLIGVPTMRYSRVAPDTVETQELLRPIDVALPMLLQHIDTISDASAVAPAGRDAAESEASLPEVSTGAETWVTQGSLDDGAETYFPGRFAKRHRIELAADDTVHVRLRSDEFDAYLVVLDPDGNVVLEVDDSHGAGLNVDEVMETVDPGPYTFVVTSAFRHEQGRYTLEVVGAITASEREDAPAASSPPVRPERAVGAPPAAFDYSGVWTGTIVDSYAGHGTVRVVMHQDGATLFGTWQSAFAMGSNSGTLTGLLQSDGVHLELSPSDPSSCPFRGVIERVDTTIGGTYVAFDCAIPISGTITLTKR